MYEIIVSESSCVVSSWGAGSDTWECPERAVGQGSRLRWPGGHQTKVARGWPPPRCLSSPGWLEKDMNKGLGSSLKGEQAFSGARPNYPPRGDTTSKVTV